VGVWDRNGVGPFNVTIKKALNDNWLIILDDTIKYKNITTNHLLCKAQKKHAQVNLLKDKFEDVLLEIAIMPDLNEKKFYYL
jgi:hypothetical protein